MSKKGFQYGREHSSKDIAMPAEGEVSTVEKLTNPGAYPQEAAPAQSPTNAFGEVPQDLPEETRSAMQSMMQEEEPAEEVQEFEEEEEIEEEVVPVARATAKSKTKEDNFAELRMARERAEREKQRVEQERDAFMSQMLALQAQINAQKKKEPEEDYDLTIGDEDLVAGKDVRKVDARTRALEKKLAQYEAQSRESANEARVRSKCPDIDTVVTDENIYLLRQNYPEVAQSLAVTPDNWDKLASVYTMIKTLGIHKTRSYESDKMKAVTNVKKPRPMASISPQQAETPLSKANAFAQDYKISKETKANTWKEMQEAMKRA